MNAAISALPAAVRGAVWMILAAAAFAGLIVTIRVLSSDFSPFVILFLRSAIGGALFLPSAIGGGRTRFATTRLRVHGARAVAMWVAMILWYYAIANIAMADAVALQFTLPLFLVLLSAIFLNEATGPKRWALLLVGFAGTLIILRPGFTATGLPALAALSCALFYAVAHTMTKILARTDSGAAIAFYMNLLLLPISAVAAAFAWTTPQWHHTPWLIALGVFGNLSQVFLAKSLATAPTSAVMPFDFSRLIFIAVIGFVFFDEVSDTWTWVGASVIFGSAYLIARDEIRRG